MLSEKPWRVDAVVRLVLAIFAVICSIMLVAGLIQQVSGHKLDQNSPWVMVLGTLAVDGPILVMVCAFLFFQRISWTGAFGFNSPGLGMALLLGFIVGLGFLPLGFLLKTASELILNSLHVATQEQQPVQILEQAAPGLARVGLAFFAVALAPLAEETLFRGVLYPTIKQFGFPRTALWSTSFVFALIHNNLAAFVPLMILAVALALLYEKTNNLLACITAHATFNGANVVLLYLNEAQKYPAH